jgi:hypothetical protein
MSEYVQRMFVMVVGVIMAVAIAVMLHTVLNLHWEEPYGGCKEALQYPGTPGFIDCVQHGRI